ncbi:VOC family protein [Sphingomonas sp.]|uniref:VOC family protein n=1 Tax=Sphingomonas sp. TaxID=28214 RepID=UPI0025F947BB|nr:VOC family protein [Sphingomonas sp.]
MGSATGRASNWLDLGEEGKMIDHIGIGASDFEASKRFYDAALATLDFGMIMEVLSEESGGYHGIGYGKDGKPFFWLGDDGPRGTGIHVAFSAASRSQVDAFYAAALGAGGKDNGAPGLRPHYHPNYYAAFVIDPDGLNVEAVCHAPA